MHKTGDDTPTANGADEFQESPITTDLRADTLNTWQRELVKIVEGAGLALDSANDEQIWSILKTAVQFFPHGESVPSMKVIIEAGNIFTGGVHVAKATQTTTVIAAPSADPRIDTIGIKLSDGSYVIKTGAEAAGPVSPGFDLDVYPVCEFQLEMTTTFITLDAQTSTNSQIQNKRPLIHGSNKVRNWGFTIANFSAPGTSPIGVVVDPATGNLISCDVVSNLIYIHDGISIAVLSSFSAQYTDITGVAVDPATGNLISCDNNTDLIYIHDGISSTVLSSFSAPDTLISDVAVDPATGNLISCDLNSDLIYIHDGISSTVLSSFSPPDTLITGVAVDPATGNLITCGNNTNLIYIHDGISGTVLSSFSTPDTFITSVAVDPATGNLISCDNNTNSIYIHLTQHVTGYN